MKDRIRITPKMAHLAEVVMTGHRRSLRPAVVNYPLREQAGGMFNMIEHQTDVVSHETMFLVDEAIT